MPNEDGTQMRVALQPADTKLQAWFAKAVVVISVLRGLSLRVRIYVIPLERTTTGINKAEDAEGGCPNRGSPMRCGGPFLRRCPAISNFVAGSARRPGATEDQ